MIGRSGERGSGISVLAARHNDDNNTNDSNGNQNGSIQNKNVKILRN